SQNGTEDVAAEVHGPAVRVQPALLFFACLLGGAGLDRVMPLPLVKDIEWRAAVATPLLLAAFALGFWALRTLARHGTSPDVHVASSALVTTGPYRFMRNPLYVALLLTLSGFAFLLSSLWVLMLVVVLGVLIDRLVIPAEERYLAETFGDAYRAY